MFSLKRTAILLAFAASTSLFLPAQSSSSQTQPTAPAASSSQAPASPAPSSLTVQERLRQRKEQRRLAAIQEVYSHLYEAYVGTGYERFAPGPGVNNVGALQHMNETDWNVGVTRYFSERLGVTIDGRGAYGNAYLRNNAANQSHAEISQYAGLIGPTWRFVLHPRYSVAGRVMAGAAYGHFSADTNGFGATAVGLYPDGAGAAVSVSAPLEYNVSPALGLRLAPEYFLTEFGSKIQNNRGFTAGMVYRWGKQ